MGHLVLLTAGDPSLVPGISHDHLLITLLQVALLLLLARVLGHAVGRLGMPSVLGELLAGLLAGPSILGALAPDVFEWLFPPEALQRNLLDLVAFLGVLLLMVLTGLEINLPLIMSKGRAAAKVSFGGIAVPFVLGVLTAFYLVPGELLTDAPKPAFALFVGTALSISAIPVIAKVLIDLRMIKRDIGQLTLAAGMVDDAAGWVLLSVVAGLASSGVFDIGVAVRALVIVVGVVGVTLTIGRRLFGALLRWIDVSIPGPQAKVTLLLVVAFGMAAVTHALGIEAVLGAFLAGIAFGTFRRFDHHLVELIETFTLAVFAPIFFARAGLAVDLAALLTPQVLAVGALVLAVAIAGKFIGAYGGSAWAGLSRFEALSLGAGMNARGALEIIIATIGLNIGVLTTQMYTIIVMVAIVTSLMAPPILRYTMARVPPSPAERDRLEREERQRRSFLGNVRRILLPTRGGHSSQIAAQLLGRMFTGDEVEVTLLYAPDTAGGTPAGRASAGGASGGEASAGGASGGGVTVPGGEVAAAADVRLARVEQHLRGLPRLELRRVVRASDDAVRAVLEETARGCDLVVLGATSGADGRAVTGAVLFSRFVDPIVQRAACPVLVVSLRPGALPAQTRDGSAADLPLRRIMLPTLGEQTDRQAAEVAFAVARQHDAVVDAVHFLQAGRSISAQMDLSVVDEARRIADSLVAKEEVLGRQAGVVVNPRVVPTTLTIEAAIIDYATTTGADLIVFRSDERGVSQRVFFSHPLDHILAHAPCPVAIISGT